MVAELIGGRRRGRSKVNALDVEGLIDDSPNLLFPLERAVKITQ